jgi:hypothetical protein
LATGIHRDSECVRCHCGLVKNQRVCTIVRHIEKVLRPGNKVKTTQVMANFDFGENSLGIRDVRIMIQNVQRCICKYVPELAAVLPLAQAPSQPAPTTRPAQATNVVPSPVLLLLLQGLLLLPLTCPTSHSQLCPLLLWHLFNLL